MSIVYKVLIADDEEKIRKGIAKLIKYFQMDLEVCGCAKNGIEAIELLELHSPDILIIDINMPFMNGLEAIKTIRKANSNVVIIIISGYDKFEYAQKAIEYQVSKYLLKPFDNNEFKSILLKAISTIESRTPELTIASQELTINETYSKQEIISYINQNYRNPDISLTHLEDVFNIGRTSIANYLKKETGKTFVDYVTFLKIEQAKSLLLNSDLTINKISDFLGFNNQHYFSKVFKSQVGLSPLQFKVQHS